jgi:hypothetical protein
VSAVAKRLVAGMAASAERDFGSFSNIKDIAIHIFYDEVTAYSQRSIILRFDFGRGHLTATFL